MKADQIKEALMIAIKAKRPVMIWGPPGAGKSQVVAQVAKAMGRKLIDVRASLLDPVDLRGVPSIEDGRTKWNPPVFLPSEPGCIIFLDEITSAPPLTQSGLYQLVLDGKLGEYELPPDTVIIGAGNRETDKAVVHRMSTALANRFLHLDFDICPKAWEKHALQADFAIEVIAFIRFREKLLFTFDPKKNDKAFATPRTWEFVSDIIKQSPPKGIMLEMISGLVGNGPATEFVAFYSMWKKLPNPDMVLMDPMNAEIPTEASVLFALAVALGRKATENNADRFFTYIDRIPAELGAVAVLEAKKKTPAIQNTKGFITWSIKNEKATT